MQRALLSLVTLCCVSSSASAAGDVAPPRFDAQGRTLGQPLSDRVVRYDIEATLEAAAKRLHGHEVIHWRNRSSEPQSTLWFHLYWNAFKGPRSTFAEDAETLRGAPAAPQSPETAGSMEVESLSVLHGADLLPSFRFQHPDDDNLEDQTVFTVQLPKAVPPGGEVALELGWTSRIPKVQARSGYGRDYFLMGQWFPKLGVLEVAGERGAAQPRWNCHAYHSMTEFYADFGTFDVQLTVPKEMVVGATGVQVSRHEEPTGTTTYRFHQDDVHDFAWTAWKGFVERHRTFRAPGLPPVELSLLLPPEQLASAPDLLDAAETALRRFGTLLTPYPYSRLTLVAPPEEGRASSGMEYPTFVTVLSRQFPQRPHDAILWDVAVHEIAHNFFYGLVASNEFEEPWLDEGMANYQTARLLEHEGLTLDLAQALPPSLRALLGGIFQTELSDADRSFITPALRYPSNVEDVPWHSQSAGDAAVRAYQRAQDNYETLEGLLGRATMDEVFRVYAQRWRFRHPAMSDFFQVAQEVSGRDLSALRATLFSGTDGVDYAVTQIACRRRGELQRCDVRVERLAGGALPVELEVRFEDGSRVTESWGGREAWKRFRYERSSAVASAEVDPRHKLVVDADKTNNLKTRSLHGQQVLSEWGWLTYAGQWMADAVGALF